MQLHSLVFCLFADDTGIFDQRDLFSDLINNRTSEDGRDTGSWLMRLFEVLNQIEASRPMCQTEMKRCQSRACTGYFITIWPVVEGTSYRLPVNPLTYALASSAMSLNTGK